MTEYVQIQPSSFKSVYLPNDNIDFNLTFVNKSIVRNSVRLSGVLKVKNDGEDIQYEKVYYDPCVGVHSFFNNFVVSTQNNRQIAILENQPDYARYIKMRNTATKTQEQMITSGRLVNELLMSDYSKTNKYLTDALPFYMKPDICINNCSGNIDYSKSGDIKVSFRLVAPVECLFGPDMTNQVSYEISKLTLEYRTTAEMKQPVMMVVKQSVNQSINSNNATVSVQLPATVNSLVSSFMRVAEERQLTVNNLELEMPLGMNKLYYQFNNAGQYIAYPLESVQDMLQHYIDGFHANDAIYGKLNDHKNDITLKKLNDNKIFGVGIDFSDNINLMNSSFALNLMTGVKSDDPYRCWIYFNTLVNL
jgi:regulator of replication initiation timing